MIINNVSMHYLNSLNDLEMVDVCGEPFLITQNRIDKSKLPDFMCAFDIRSDDEGNAATIEKNLVSVNLFGTLLGHKDSTYKINFNEDGVYDCSDSINWTGVKVDSVLEFFDSFPQKWDGIVINKKWM